MCAENPQPCEAARSHLAALSGVDPPDGALGPEVREELLRHVGSCSRCARALAGSRRTVGLLRELPPLRAPRGFAEAVLEKIGEVRARRRIWMRREAPLLAAAAVFLAALVAGVFILWSRSWAPKGPELAKAPEARETEEPSEPGPLLAFVVTVPSRGALAPDGPDAFPREAATAASPAVPPEVTADRARPGPPPELFLDVTVEAEKLERLQDALSAWARERNGRVEAGRAPEPELLERAKRGAEDKEAEGLFLRTLMARIQGDEKEGKKVVGAASRPQRALGRPGAGGGERLLRRAELEGGALPEKAPPEPPREVRMVPVRIIVRVGE